MLAIVKIIFPNYGADIFETIIKYYVCGSKSGVGENGWQQNNTKISYSLHKQFSGETFFGDICDSFKKN